MIVLDASVWVSWLLPQDIHHTVSRQWLSRWSGSGQFIAVPTIFLDEVAGAVARRSGSAGLGQRAVGNILRDPTIRTIVVDRPLAEIAARHAASLPLKGADALYVALAEQSGVPLVTWDQEQLTRAARLISVRTPTV